MTPRHLVRIAAAALAAALVAPVAAHHSFAAVYDGSRTVTLDGKVTEFRFVNPHAFLKLDVSDAAGAVQKWTVEFPGRLNLTTGGWTETTFAVGEQVTVSGSPARTGGSGIFFVKLVRADGSELQLPGAERANAIDEERRQRALQRDTPASGK